MDNITKSNLMWLIGLTLVVVLAWLIWSQTSSASQEPGPETSAAAVEAPAEEAAAPATPRAPVTKDQLAKDMQAIEAASSAINPKDFDEAGL